MTLCLSYCQRPAVSQADSGPYHEPLLPQSELNNIVFKNTYSYTSTPHIRLGTNTFPVFYYSKCIFTFSNVIVIFCAGEIINSVVICITIKRSGIEGKNMRNRNVKENVEICPGIKH